MGLGTSATSFIDQTLDFTCDVCFAQGKVTQRKIVMFLHLKQHTA